jgi:hypothetical protein
MCFALALKFNAVKCSVENVIEEIFRDDVQTF